jgi:hypothetical protein
MFDYNIPADEPVCLNCNDEGCEYCDDYEDECDWGEGALKELCESLTECNDCQPDEYTEWQDVYGGDDWDHGQYDHYDEW